jgi:hypothetical protein
MLRRRPGARSGSDGALRLQHPDADLAKLKKRPLVQTKYRWEYAGGEAAEGGTITITGRTTPAKPGHTPWS